MLLTLFWNELGRNLRLWWSYRVNAISSLIFWAVAFLLTLLMFDSIAAGYGPVAQAASLVGFLMWNLCLGMVEKTTLAVSDEVKQGTLENVLLAPITPLSLFSLRIAVSYTQQIFETTILGLVLMLILRLPVAMNVSALFIIGLTMLAVGGGALALCGLALVYKNVASFVGVVTLLALFLTGAILPLNELGTAFTLLKYLFPPTWGIDALRQATVYGVSSLTLWTNGTIPGLGLQMVVFIGIGVVVLNWGFRRAQRQGSLGTY